MINITHDEFAKEMEGINPNIKILGIFVNLTTKIKVECLIDGHIWDAPPRKLLKGIGCQICSTRKNGQTHSISPEQFIKTIGEINPNVKIIGTYVNATTKVTTQCLLDGHVWDSFPSTLYKGGCPECKKRKISKSKSYTHEQYVKNLKTRNPNIEVIGIYCGARYKLKVRCIKHNYIWDAYPSNLNDGGGCTMCKSEKLSDRAISHDEFTNKLLLINKDIEVIDKYKNCDNNILVRCKKHDITWFSTGARLLHGCGCIECGKEKSTASQRFSNSEVVDRLSLLNPNIVLIGDYIGSRYKSRFKCLVCGNEWEATFNNISLGHGCPVCVTSKGEASIKSALDSTCIIYNYQHIFHDCKNVSPLRFDFYIPSENMVIEFQGEQHYKPVDFAGKGEKWADERFAYGQINDKIKRNYCEANNIRLIEIRYDEINKIADVISDILAVQ